MPRPAGPGSPAASGSARTPPCARPATCSGCTTPTAPPVPRSKGKDQHQIRSNGPWAPPAPSARPPSWPPPRPLGISRRYRPSRRRRGGPLQERPFPGPPDRPAPGQPVLRRHVPGFRDPRSAGAAQVSHTQADRAELGIVQGGPGLRGPSPAGPVQVGPSRIVIVWTDGTVTTVHAPAEVHPPCSAARTPVHRRGRMPTLPARLGLLRIGLHGPAARLRDQVQGTCRPPPPYPRRSNRNPQPARSSGDKSSYSGAGGQQQEGAAVSALQTPTPSTPVTCRSRSN